MKEGGFMKKRKSIKKRSVKLMVFVMMLFCVLAYSQNGLAIEPRGEAPSLESMVENGEIPSLEDRLPVQEDIMVEEIGNTGNYGDILTMSFQGKSSKWGYGMITEEPLFRFTMDGGLEPNVAKGYDVNEDATVYTIYLRDGMKWSDGVPFTAEDVIFFYEHMALKETFGKSLWNCFKSTNKYGESTPATMTKIDDTTVKVTFADPNPMFLENVAIDAKWFFAPAHYYKKMLPEFIGEEAAKAKAAEMGYADIAALGKETGYYYWNIVGRPTLRPWVAQNDPSDAETFIMARNPYYWKTDAEGKQLPYIDQLHFIRISDEAQNVLLSMDGTLDFASLTYDNIVSLKENQKMGGYELYSWSTNFWTNMGLELNQAVKDDKLRKLFQDIRFREALSVAVDRNLYTEIVTDGFGIPQQAAPPKGAFGYEESALKKWTEYDPERAESILVEIGLVKGNNGFFKFADGTPLTLNIMTWDQNIDEVGELLIKFFEEIGLDTTYKVVDRALGDEMIAGNEHEVWLQDIDLFNPALRPDNVVPIKTNIAWYGGFGSWYLNGGEGAIEPTAEIKELLKVYEEMNSATSKDQIDSAANKIVDMHNENTWIIGYASRVPQLMVVDGKLRNFPEYGIFCDEYRLFGIAHFATLFFAE